MPGTLPVPLSIELPEGWQSAPPEEVGAPHAAFVALHMASRGQGFMPNITVTGHTLDGPSSLHGLAEESVRRLRENVGAVEVVKRTEVGTSPAPGLIDAPGIVQNLRIQAIVNGQPMELAQSQFILVLENEPVPADMGTVFVHAGRLVGFKAAILVDIAAHRAR